MSTEILGAEEVRKNLDEQLARLLNGAIDVLKGQAAEVLKRSQGLVPVRTGALRDSGYVSAPNISPRRVEVEIGFSAPYAAEVHEDLGARHGDGQAKFLEAPAASSGVSLQRALVERLKIR